MNLYRHENDSSHLPKQKTILHDWKHEAIQLQHQCSIQKIESSSVLNNEDEIERIIL